MHRTPRLAWFLAVLLAATSAKAQHVADGGFDSTSGWGNLGSGASIQTEAGNRVLRVSQPGNAASQVVRLEPNWKTITVSVRMKARGLRPGEADWQDARLAVTFHNADGSLAGYGDSPRLREDSDWKVITRVIDVPEGAATVTLSPSLLGPAGEIFFDDVQLTPEVGPAETPPGADATLPAGVLAASDAKPTEPTSARGEIDLSGAWRFAPLSGDGAVPPTTGRGWIRVPGSWTRPEDIVASVEGGAWRLVGTNKLGGGWYETSVVVPEAWGGRAIVLDLARVSTDAVVFVDGREAGRVNWPEGQVDLTDHLQPGKPATLLVKVVATLDKDEVLVLMGTTPGQNWTAKAELKSGGLVGDVKLIARPRGAHVSGVFVKTSTREGAVAVDVEVEGATGGTARFTAEMLDEQGRVEKTFEAEQAVGPGDSVVTLRWPWSDARLWDVGKPNLYTLRLRASGAGLDDHVAQRFGFREFWIEGRDYYLNGTKFRARTDLVGGTDQGPSAAEIDEAFSYGYNLGEYWPGDTEERSVPHFGRRSYAIADEKGFPLTGVMPHMGWMGMNVDSPGELARLAEAAARVARRDRNHPSILMWGTSGNMFGGMLDPAIVGQREASARVSRMRSPHMNEPRRHADAGVAAIKEADPTRPVFIHNGGNSSDVYTINHYLNWVPLQEREEWLSAYVEKGDTPLWYVEFGTPVALSLLRGRNGFQNAATTEPFLSEYTAIYLGREAYKLEPKAYRQVLKSTHKSGPTYSVWWAFEQNMHFSQSWLRVQELFLTNTWRSWRTYGMTGGMIAWDSGYVKHEGKRTIAGEALARSNAPTLAWISGPDGAIADKTRNYRAGDRVTKRIALLNDSREQREFHVEWRAVGAEGPAAGSESGRLEVGETRFVPVEFTAAAKPASKIDGHIEISASIGDAEHVDRFEFRVFPADAPVAAATRVLLLDPVGKTRSMLEALGVATGEWDGQPAGRALLVIGREAMSGEVPAGLRAFVEAGGRVLVMAQSQQTLRDHYRFRISPHAARRVFRVDGDHPVTRGLDDLDLRDWAGTGTMLEAYPDYVDDPAYNAKTETNYPYYAWRWGTRHSVASVPIEKPHQSAWRPILECEFDLAYTPLMELELGSGRIVWCQLDLEDQVAQDPAAEKLARQLVEYAATEPAVRKAERTTYVGDDAGAALLQSLSVAFDRADALPTGDADDALAVVGSGAAVSDAEAERFVRSGGRLLVLARREAKSLLGVTLRSEPEGNGSLDVPAWPEARGLSASDLRTRAATPMWFAASGAPLGADGLLARRTIGSGVGLFCQLDPDALDADRHSYQRLTRWRQHRAIAQLLANLGASFESDGYVFDPPRAPQAPAVVDLSGPWQAELLSPLPAAPSPDRGHADPGVSDAAERLLASREPMRLRNTARMPAPMEGVGDGWGGADGEAVFARSFDVPEELRGRDLLLSLGAVDDFDVTHVNGERVGGIGAEDPAAYSKPRLYPVPASLLKPTGNVVVVRVWDRYGGGGFTGDASELRLHAAETSGPQKQPRGWYHPDYLDDFKLGDDPYRYYNW